MEDEQQVSSSRFHEPQLTGLKLYAADVPADESDGTHEEHLRRAQHIGDSSQQLDVTSRWRRDSNLALTEEVRPERCRYDQSKEWITHD